MPEPIDLQISRLAASQHGVVTRAQALGLGATPGRIQHRLASQRWERLHPGVYRLPGAPPGWRQALMAAALALGEGAAASHRTAAALWEMPGFNHGAREFSVRRGCDVRVAGVAIHRARALDPVDITVVDSIPVTTPARTLVDVAGLVTAGMLEDALDDILRRGLVSPSRLRWRLDALGARGRAGAGALGTLLRARGRGPTITHSVFESRLLRLLRRARLPEPVAQFQLKARGRAIARVDLAYPDRKVAIEADGYRWHTGRSRFDADLARRNAMTTLGWRVIHVTWTQLTDAPAEVVEQIASALRA